MMGSPPPPPGARKGRPSSDVQISALDLDISLVDNLVFRKLLGVTEAFPSDKSSSTNTLQERASPPLEKPHDPLVEGETAGEFLEEGGENLPALEQGGSHLYSSFEIRAPEPAPAEGPAPENLEPPFDGLSVDQDDYDSVAQACLTFMETVTMGTYDAPKRTADLYAPDGVLWGTEVHAPDDPLWGLVTEEVRDTPEAIYAYYDYFARLPKLRLVEYAPAPVRVHGDFGAQASTHKFAWQGVDGTTVEVRGRSSFTFRRDYPGRANPWSIVEHCCFSMPTAASELKDFAMADWSVRTAPSSSSEITDECSAPVFGSFSSTSPYPDDPESAAAIEVCRTSSFQIQDRLFAEELAAREKQIAELQHRAETAESLAAERAVLLEMERLARAKHYAELEKRAFLSYAELEKRAYMGDSLSSELDIQAAAAAAELEKQAAEHKKEVSEAAKALAAGRLDDEDAGSEQGTEIYI
ncbi:unnamed protein product [Pylaiella littoralis]